MNIYYNIKELPVFHNAVITIGSFDGVHSGHTKIIHQLKEEAQKINGCSVVITFHPHPKQIIGNSNYSISLLNTPEEKSFLLEKAGINHLVIVPFSKEFSELTAASYISDFLVKNFHPHTIITGYDHRFGKNRTGNYELLESFSNQYGYKVKEIPEYVINDISISSTSIRAAINNGDIEEANKLLGYPYFFSGIVIKGLEIGRTIDFPTANILVSNPDKLLPANGVYAVKVKIDNNHSEYKGMMNIGNKPTFEKNEKTIEVNIFNFNEDIYNQRIQIFLQSRLRSEIKFSGIEELKKQLHKDKEICLSVL